MTEGLGMTEGEGLKSDLAVRSGFGTTSAEAAEIGLS